VNKQLIANIIGTQNFFWSSIATEFYNKNGLLAWSSNIDNKYFNGATSIDRKLTERELVEITDFFKARNVLWLWNLNPISAPEFTEELLIAQGFNLACTYEVMWYDLSSELPDLDLKKYTIKEAIDKEGLNDWCIPMAEGFSSSQEFARLIEATPYGNKKSFHHYIVYLDKKPVSCATLSVSEYGTRIDNVATCKDFLRQGFGRAITLFAMTEAKKLGYKMLCLESSDEGLELYLNMGFMKAYQNKVYEVKY
jgi:hypothetical protein